MFHWARRAISRFLYPEGRRSFLWARHYCQALATYPEVERSGPLLLPYLVLLRMGFALPDGIASSAVRSYRTFSPLPKTKLASGSRRYIFCGTFREIRFERTPPAVSRHAALWRPDFPPAGSTHERPPVRQARLNSRRKRVASAGRGSGNCGSGPFFAGVRGCLVAGFVIVHLCVHRPDVGLV